METMEQFIVVIPTLVALCVGWLVKHVIPSDAVNRFIPLIAAVRILILPTAVTAVWTSVGLLVQRKNDGS